MSKLEEEFQISKSGYYKILFSSLAASIAIYDNEPVEKLNDELVDYNHKIKEAIESRDKSFIDKVRKNDLIYAKYMICDDNKKYLIAAFRGTKVSNIFDIFADLDISLLELSGIPGKFHSGFAKRSLEIPIDFFLDKLLEDDYTIVFTGHSLGAATAALVAIRVLYHVKIYSAKKLHKKVLFIGFGSPALADEKFKKESEKYFKNNFHFYVNKQDIVVHLMEHLKKICNDFGMEILIQLIESHNLNQKDICKKVNHLKKLRNIPNYEHFGRFVHLYNSLAPNIEYEYEISDYKYSEDGLELDDHNKKNYLEGLVNIYNNDNINIVRDKKIEVDYYDELWIPTERLEKRNKNTFCDSKDCNDTPCNKYSITILKNPLFLKDITYVCFSICCQNADYILRSSLEIDCQIREYMGKERYGRNSLEFWFMFEKSLLFKQVEEKKLLVLYRTKEVLKCSKLAINFITHFQVKKFEFPISDLDVNESGQICNSQFDFYQRLVAEPIVSKATPSSKPSTLRVSFENKDRSKEISLFITNDPKQSLDVNNINNFAIFDDFSEIKQKVGSYFGISIPRFESYFQKSCPIDSLDEMLSIRETRFVVY